MLDEADLLLSYGYEEDLAALAPQVPRGAQCLLMSATSSADVDRLTKLVLSNPLKLDLLGAATGGADGGEVRPFEYTLAVVVSWQCWACSGVLVWV